MQIETLRIRRKKTRKTIGRGGKKGTYSGKGMKGQKSRSGVSIDPLFEGGRSSLIQRMKKKRGFKSIAIKKLAVRIDLIEKKFNNGDNVSIQELLDKKLISKKESKFGVKIVGNIASKKKFLFDKNIYVSGIKFEKTEKKKENKTADAKAEHKV